MTKQSVKSVFADLLASSAKMVEESKKPLSVKATDLAGIMAGIEFQESQLHDIDKMSKDVKAAAKETAEQRTEKIRQLFWMAAKNEFSVEDMQNRDPEMVKKVEATLELTAVTIFRQNNEATIPADMVWPTGKGKNLKTGVERWGKWDTYDKTNRSWNIVKKYRSAIRDFGVDVNGIAGKNPAVPEPKIEKEARTPEQEAERLFGLLKAAYRKIDLTVSPIASRHMMEIGGIYQAQINAATAAAEKEEKAAKKAEKK